LNIITKKASFISRLHPKTKVHILKNGIYHRLDFKELYHRINSQKKGWEYLSVFIGDERIPVNMTVEIVPEEVQQRRIRNAEKNNKKKGRKTSENYKFFSSLSIFITNIPKEELPPRIISTLYRIRWQIELIFKVWKSIFGINHKSPMKFKRWLCLLYVRLLIMIINWNIILNRRNYLHKCSGDLLSLYKCFKTLFENNHRLRKALRRGKMEVRELLTWANKILNNNHWLEEKNKSKGLKEILSIKICKSNKYAYI
jgi:IS4 transposase